MTVKEYHLYPEYRITGENKSLKVDDLLQLKNERHAAINKALTDNAAELKVQQRYFISLPTNEDHAKVHPICIAGGMFQRVQGTPQDQLKD